MTMLHFDLYKQPFRLLLPDGKNEYRTFAGAVLSLVTILVILSYGGFKFTELVSNQNYTVKSHELDDYYAETEPITQNEGL